MLEVKDLEVYYGMIQAIKGISFEVNKGEVIEETTREAPIAVTTAFFKICLVRFIINFPPFIVMIV